MVAAEATGESVAPPPPCWFSAVDEVFRGILGATAVGVDCGGRPAPEPPLGDDAGLWVEAIAQPIHCALRLVLQLLLLLLLRSWVTRGLREREEGSGALD